DIDEAITLGTHVGVMTAGPSGTLKTVVPIEIEGDRVRSDKRYGEYYEEIYSAIRDEVERSKQYEGAA
ncbi:MAG: ABC transporter ATP-binding protein, partial [Bauldia litoralis]